MQPGDQADIVGAEQALATAHLTLDVETIASLLHDEYVIVQPGGKIETKAEVLASYQTGTRHWQEAGVEDLDVRFYGDMARVVGTWRARGTNAGDPFHYRAKFISIWIREDGRWQNLSYASAEITG